MALTRSVEMRSFNRGEYASDYSKECCKRLLLSLNERNINAPESQGLTRQTLDLSPIAVTYIVECNDWDFGRVPIYV